MSYKNWKLKKTELNDRLDEYAQVADWCNHNKYHIEEDSVYYRTVENPLPPEPTHEEKIKKQIQDLEEQITSRNLRSAIFGDEYAIKKIKQIEYEIEELRKQL